MGRARKNLVGLLIPAFVLLGTIAFFDAAPLVSGVSNAASESALYTPQLSRNQEWLGNLHGTFNDSQINAIAKNVSYFTISKNEGDGDLASQFEDARRIVAAAKTYGNPIKVFAYYGATYFFDQNFPHNGSRGWGSYLKTFKTDWYMKDAGGNAIKLYGDHGTGEARAHMLDLSNSEYRNWAVSTLLDWMKQAPFAGVSFDNSVLLTGTDSSPRITGGASWNDFLCGRGAPVDAAGNCARMAAWNAGLIAFMTQIRSAMKARGKEVMYNGIAPGPAHGRDRNLRLLPVVGAATDESFCYNAGKGGGGDATLTPMLNDIKLMRSEATAGHKLFMFTNHRHQARKQALASYCLAGFLMGWQPGYNYFVYHAYYTDKLADGYPEIAEQNLNLGLPTSQFVQHDNVLTRTFQNGFVAVNIGNSPGSIGLPSDLVEFRNGTKVGAFAKGTTTVVPSQSGRFFLTAAFANRR